MLHSRTLQGRALPKPNKMEIYPSPLLPMKWKYDQSTLLVYLVSEEFLDDIHVDFSRSTRARPETPGAFKSWRPTSASGVFWLLFFQWQKNDYDWCWEKNSQLLWRLCIVKNLATSRLVTKNACLHATLLLLLLMLEFFCVCIFCCCSTLQITLLLAFQYWFKIISTNNFTS